MALPFVHCDTGQSWVVQDFVAQTHELGSDPIVLDGNDADDELQLSMDDEHLSANGHVDPDSEADSDSECAAQEQAEVQGGESRSAASEELSLQATPAGAVSVENFGMPLSRSAQVTSINQRYLIRKDAPSEAELKQLMWFSHFALQSAMATGKSHLFIQCLLLLLLMYPELKILLITSRITLACSLQERLKAAHLSCVSYLDESVRNDPTLFEESSCVIIQLDSLPKLSKIPRFDVVLLDESESTMKHFSAKTLAARCDVWQQFKLYCTYCTQLIMMDAFFGARGEWWLQQMYAAACNGALSLHHRQLSADSRRFMDDLGAPQLRICVNTCKTDQKTYIEYDEVEFSHAMHRLLTEGRKVAIACNWKKRAKILYRQIRQRHPHLHVLLYCSDSDLDAKKQIGKCNEEWATANVVIYSPVVGPGVDFNPDPAHFDDMMAFAIDRSNTCRDFMQMIGRVRQLKSDTVHVCLRTFSDGSFHCNRGYVLDSLRQGWTTLNQHQLLDPLRRQLVNPFSEAKYEDEQYLELYIFNRVEEEQSEAMFDSLFWQAVKTAGGRRKQAPSMSKDEKKEHKRFLENVTEEQLNEEVVQLVDAKSTSAGAAAAAAAGTSKEAHGHLLSKQQDIISHYRLALIFTFKDYVSAEQRDRMVAFVRSFGQPKELRHFRFFGKLNASLAHWHRAWCHKVKTDKRDYPAEFEEREEYMQMKLTKGILAIAGFTSSRRVLPSEATGSASQHGVHDQQGGEKDPAPDHANSSNSSNSSSSSGSDTASAGCARLVERSSKRARNAGSRHMFRPMHHRRLRYPLPHDLPLPSVDEESGDICSGRTVLAAEIEHRLTHEGGNQWLKANAKWIKGCFRLRIGEREFYTVEDIVRFARSVLHQMLGWGLERPNKKDREWVIDAPTRNSMLELSYVIGVARRHVVEAYPNHQQSLADLGDWDVGCAVLRWKPEFQWTLLTEVLPPYAVSHAAARSQVEDEESGGDGDSPCGGGAPVSASASSASASSCVRAATESQAEEEEEEGGAVTVCAVTVCASIPPPSSSASSSVSAGTQPGSAAAVPLDATQEGSDSSSQLHQRNLQAAYARISAVKK